MVEDAPERPDVRLGAVALVHDDLWATVRHGSHRALHRLRVSSLAGGHLAPGLGRSRLRLGESEVGDLDPSRVVLEEDVVRGEVPVHDALLRVNVVQREHRLQEDVPHALLAHAPSLLRRARDVVQQRRAVHQLHHDVQHPALAKRVEVIHDVRMLQPLQDLHLRRHPTDAQRHLLGRRAERRRVARGIQLLDGARRRLRVSRLVRAIHPTESPLSQKFRQSVLPHRSSASRAASRRVNLLKRRRRRARLLVPERTPRAREGSVRRHVVLVVSNVDERGEQTRREETFEHPSVSLDAERESQRAKRVRLHLSRGGRG